MTDPEDISEDRGFKALFSSYPKETVEVFVPELVAERGSPLSVTVLQQESALPDLGIPDRFLDVALLATWSDGSQAVIVLIEHWSEARKIDLRRVLWYVADLALRYPKAVVLPAILVTDPSTKAVSGRLEMVVAGRVTVALYAQVTRITAADLPRLRSLQNRVAYTLALMAARQADEILDVLVAYVQDMARSPGPLDDVERFLPFAMRLARMPESDLPHFRRRLEETGMINVITEMKEEAKAKVQAEAKAEGKAEASRATVASIRRLVDRGVLTRDAARAELYDLIEAGALTRDIGQEALSLLK